MSELNKEQLEKVFGGAVTPEMSEAFNRMSNVANNEYQNWLLVNQNASENEKMAKYNECLNNAYQNLSAADKSLVDSYYLNMNDNTVYPLIK